MKRTFWLVAIIAAALSIGGCLGENEPTTEGGIKKASVRVATNADGLTTEQVNVGKRLMEDNRPGAIKHLYVVSAYSGQTIIYSTVQGKVTSSGKRLSPTMLVGNSGHMGRDCFTVDFNGTSYNTAEVLQDDRTYGSSVEYLYWWDTKGVYHQHYVAGGQIVHISSEPLAVKSIIINMSAAAE